MNYTQNCSFPKKSKRKRFSSNLRTTEDPCVDNCIQANINSMQKISDSLKICKLHQKNIHSLESHFVNNPVCTINRDTSVNEMPIYNINYKGKKKLDFSLYHDFESTNLDRFVKIQQKHKFDAEAWDTDQRSESTFEYNFN